MPVTDIYFRNPAALPAMPELASRLLQSLGRDNVSLGEIAQLIERDASLAAKVLRFANSARYSPQHDIASLRDAANMIGLRSLRDISLAACLVSMFPPQARFDRERFWRLGLATAGQARALATPCGLDPDTAYLAGLLLRTGFVLMLMTDPVRVSGCDAAATVPDSLMDQERAIFDCTHAEVSAVLARRWNFPAALSAALAAAADPAAAEPFSPLGALIRLASAAAEAGDLLVPEVETLQSLHPALLARLGLDPAMLQATLLPYDLLTLGIDQLLV